MLQTAPAPSSTVPQPLEFGPLDVAFHRSVEDLGESAWAACFPDEIEDFNYHRALEMAPVPGFDTGWYAVTSRGVLAGAAPVFSTSYDLATTAQGMTARLLKAAQRWVPGRLTLRLSCLGSPVTEYCPIGLHPSLGREQRQLVMVALVDYWTQHANGQGATVQGIKDVRETDKGQFDEVFSSQGFHSIASLPSAYLPVTFGDKAGYFDRLSAATRKDMRRKLKLSSVIDIEFTSDASAVIDDVMAMYRETRARSDWAFEDVPAQYFLEVLAHKPETAVLALYRCEGRLVGANLLLQNDRQLLDKFFVARAADTRAHNLYFLSWFANVERCLQCGLDVYVSGAAGYETKLRLACRLEPNWIYFRHRSTMIHALLRAVSPWLAVPQPDAKRSNLPAPSP